MRNSFLKDMKNKNSNNINNKVNKRKKKSIKVKNENNQYLIIDYLTKQDKSLCNQLIPKFKLPDKLKSFNYLPPSLIPPTLGDFLNSSVNTWG